MQKLFDKLGMRSGNVGIVVSSGDDKQLIFLSN